MKDLEKIMRENKELFLEQEPSSGHFEKFEHRLRKQNRRGKVIQLSTRIARLAAIGLLVLMSSLWAISELSDQEEPGMKLSEVSSEYEEVEFFFTSQINDRYKDIENLELVNEGAYKDLLFKELEQMDSVYMNLQKELGAHPNDERIIRAMILHYQTKLKVMSDILNRLSALPPASESNSNNQNQYESVEL